MFVRILNEAQRPVVITVSAKKGTGKSTFLDLLEELARADFGAAVCRYSLKEDGPLMSLTDFVHGRLIARDPELSADSRYAALKLALHSNDDRAFGFPRPQPVTVHHVQSTITVTESDVPGTIVGPQIGGHWGPGHVEEARLQCYDALLDDLHALSRRGRVVLLLDQYERATDEIEEWLEKALLTRVLYEPKQFGPIVMVVASTRRVFETVATELGPRAAEVLHAIEGLSAWNDDHIAQWLELLGINEDKLVPIIRRLFDQKKASLKDIQVWLAGMPSQRTPEDG